MNRFLIAWIAGAALAQLAYTIGRRRAAHDIETAIRDAVATDARCGYISVTAAGATHKRYEAALAQQTLRQAQKRSARSVRGWRTRRKHYDMRPIAANIAPLGTLEKEAAQ